MHIVTYERPYWGLEQAEVVHDSLIGWATAHEAARCVVGGTHTVKRDVDVVHVATQKQVHHVLGEQVTIREDPGLVLASALLGQAYEPRRERLYHVCPHQWLATEPGDGELLRVRGIEHASHESNDVILDLG